MNPFRTVLLTKGFSEGASGRFLSPDCKRGDGVVVELQGVNAVACWKGGRTLFENTPKDIARFRQEVV